MKRLWRRVTGYCRRKRTHDWVEIPNLLIEKKGFRPQRVLQCRICRMVGGRA